MGSLILARTPFLKLVRSEKPVPYSIDPGLPYSLMPFPRCQGRQPLQNLALLVWYRYLCSITNVSICYRTHLVLPTVLLLVVGGAVCRLKDGVKRDRKDCWGGAWAKVGEVEKSRLCSSTGIIPVQYKQYRHSSCQIEVAFSQPAAKKKRSSNFRGMWREEPQGGSSDRTRIVLQPIRVVASKGQ